MLILDPSVGLVGLGAVLGGAAILATRNSIKVDVYEGKIAVQWGEALTYNTNVCIQPGDIAVRPCEDFRRGRGSFVTRPSGLESGTFLGCYNGDILSRVEFQTLYVNKGRLPDYVMHIDADMFVDASTVIRSMDPKKFHPACINHAREPQSNVVRRCVSRRPPRVEIFTSRFVSQGDELFMNYGDNFWKGRELDEIL